LRMQIVSRLRSRAPQSRRDRPRLRHRAVADGRIARLGCQTPRSRVWIAERLSGPLESADESWGHSAFSASVQLGESTLRAASVFSEVISDGRSERRCCSLGVSIVTHTELCPRTRHGFHESGSIRAESISHHVAGDVGRSELRTQTVEGRAVIVGDGNDVALCHAHAG
jgi:hypothetical protein